jgi:hypothetical protein
MIFLPNVGYTIKKHHMFTTFRTRTPTNGSFHSRYQVSVIRDDTKGHAVRTFRNLKWESKAKIPIST